MLRVRVASPAFGERPQLLFSQAFVGVFFFAIAHGMEAEPGDFWAFVVQYLLK
jgi:hypothetical protein